ncbi:hypothetical protein [Salmonella enterica subsp. enterica serovar Bredeney]|uniref:Uncharacterized protein n=1 Tax=Salmonella schwarzengrund (strain CVM19633) TaxID=439843 RepID=A0A0N1QZ59_SALSV|nr:hypothetical protein SeSA_A3475 [Salmonella enterica subsp. enterica serovar Schwarzengrund str. CVM19633]CAI3056542.1 hypothetical protein [Salmonella enterica subsp. enterica serovar Bredeney]
MVGCRPDKAFTPPSGNVMPDGASAYQAYSLNTVLISKRG